MLMDNSSESENMQNSEWISDALDSFLNCTDDLVAFKDLEGRYLRCNKKFAIYASVKDPQSIVGKKDRDLFPKTYCELSASQDMEVINTGKSLPLDMREVSLLNKKSIFTKSKHPLMSSDGKIIGVITVFRDITEVH